MQDFRLAFSRASLHRIVLDIIPQISLITVATVALQALRSCLDRPTVSSEKVLLVPPAKPASARARQLAAELRRLRETAALTGDEAAARLSWSASKVSRIETSRSSITMSDLRSLLDLYQASGSTRDRLLELRRTADQRGWWDAYGDTLEHNLPTFFALENDAESERFYGQMIVPGILQTSQYAEAVVRGGVLAAPPGEIARRVQARMSRQHLLTKDDPLHLSVVLDEAALRRQIGGSEVIAGQIAHLIEMAARPNITLQILPFDHGAHMGLTGTFALLLFPGPPLSYVAYLENLTTEFFVEAEAEAYQYALSFDRLSEVSLEPAASIALAEQIAREITEGELTSESFPGSGD